MTYEEALSWLSDKRSTINVISQYPLETWQSRIAETDLLMIQQAYWIAKAYKEGLVISDPIFNNRKGE
ncbi:MAG TPA: hypothetical protein ENG87_00390 [Candidatus Pacearchaeota archaeon]|nr:hypothetical protein [Candidatus Pacearchaeota archaeon]